LNTIANLNLVLTIKRIIGAQLARVVNLSIRIFDRKV
jgi:hypothetical protein